MGKTSRTNPKKNLKNPPSLSIKRRVRRAAKSKQPLAPFFFLKTAIAACLVFLLIQFGSQVLRQDDILGVSTRFDHQRVLDLINHERLRYGLSALTLNDLLDRAALLKGENMLEEQYWAHNSRSGREPWYFIDKVGYQYRSAGENLARDFGSEEEMVRAWMNSPTHRSNILNANFREMGLATLEGILKGEDILLVVNMFGAPLRTVVAETPVATQNHEEALTNETPAIVGQVEESRTGRLEQLPIPSDEEIMAIEIVPISTDSTDEAIFTSGEILGGSEPSSRMTGLNLVRIIFALAVFILIAYLIYEVIFFRSRSMREFAVKNLPHIMMLLSVLFIMLISLTGFIE